MTGRLGVTRIVIAVAAVAVIVLVAAFLAAYAAQPVARSPEPVQDGLYGPGIAMDAKNNHQVGWLANERVSHRFRASTSAALESVAVVQRGGPHYSGGDGGSIRITVEEDRSGHPSGAPLAALTVAPGNPSGHWERTDALAFQEPPPLEAGHLYHIVFANESLDPTVDYISINEAYQFEVTDPRQPAFDDDLAVLIDQGDGWTLAPNDTPVMDLAYADGTHDGLAYSSVIADRFARISGTREMARERFVVSGPSRRVTSLSVRAKRLAGTSPLVVALLAGDGTEIASGTVVADAVPLSEAPAIEPDDPNRFVEASVAGGVWGQVDFPAPTILMSGSTYEVRLSTDADSTWAVVPLREQSETSPSWGSWAFRDGDAQRMTGGMFWGAFYAPARTDLQFYFR